MYMDAKMTYQRATEKVAALRELGVMLIHLEEGPFPWGHATKCAVSSICCDVTRSVTFDGHDPGLGLNFFWSLDIDGAEGRGESFAVGRSVIRAVLMQLPVVVRDQFRQLLAADAKKARERGREYQVRADKILAAADALERLGLGDD